MTVESGGMYCRECGYDLRGTPEPRCSECGRVFDPSDPRTYQALPRARASACKTLLAYLLPVAVSTAGLGSFLWCVDRSWDEWGHEVQRDEVVQCWAWTLCGPIAWLRPSPAVSASLAVTLWVIWLLAVTRAPLRD